ncbi:MAG: LURP-one-related/scramblase family protein [Lactococcus sp.]
MDFGKIAGNIAKGIADATSNVSDALNKPDTFVKENIKLYIDQRYEWTVRDTFEITDEFGEDVYLVKGSFMKVPKHFYIQDNHNNTVAEVTEKLISALPTYFIKIGGDEVAKIRANFSLFKPEFKIAGPGLKVSGNILGNNFSILKNDKVVGKFNKNLFGYGDHYVIEIIDEQYELVVVSMVLAIDYINAKKGKDGSRR